jgi:hypothetical protein
LKYLLGLNSSIVFVCATTCSLGVVLRILIPDAPCLFPYGFVGFD